MKRILITGISGFVGGHLCHHLFKQRKDLEIYGISRSKPAWDFLDNAQDIIRSIRFHQLDLLNISKAQELVRNIQPIISSIWQPRVLLPKAGKNRSHRL